MAMSFARPDPSSPASVADAGFGTSRRGFDQGEVRDFLRMVAAELGRLQERERFLERELRTAQTNPDLDSVKFDDETLTRLLGEETARVLTTARESAAEIRQKAEQSAAQMLNEASDEAARVREEADVEASRRRSDAAADAEAELSMAKQQGREMVNEARAYRERVLSELARRRELAREQIEQLLHGRDRLMQSFERARLVAVDVVAELQPLGEPDEYVNLSPTTGPVPVMVPNSPRPIESTAVETEPADADADTADANAADADAEDVTAAADDTDTELGVAVDQATTDQPESDVDAAAEREADVDAAAEPVAVDASDVETAEIDDAAEADDDQGEPTEIGDEPEATDDVTVSDDADDDDVVVDLFARLRAGTASDAVVAMPNRTNDSAPAAEGSASDEAGVDADEASTIVSGSASDEPTTSDHTNDSTAAAEGSASDEAGVDAEEAATIDTTILTAFEERDAVVTPLIVASARKLKRVMADEQNEVLDALRRSEPVRGLDALIPATAEHVGRYQSSIHDDLVEAANAGAVSVPGRTRKLRKADAAKATGAADEVLADWLVVPLRERLERCVVDGDGDNGEIAKRARAVYREWKTQHIDEQLDDVFRAAHGHGVLAAIEPGTPVEWIADPSHQACADCDDNTLAGAVAAGAEFPTGHVCAPAHVGCRCLLAPADR